MRQLIHTKLITIETSGPLRIKGGITGPIEIPYREDVSVIGRMIMSNYKVIEHLSNGECVTLDVQNYNKENGENDMKSKYQVIKSPKEIKRKRKNPQISLNTIITH